MSTAVPLWDALLRGWQPRSDLELLDRLAAPLPPTRLHYLGVLARTAAYRKLSLRP